MKFCDNCGKRCEDLDKVCPSCGTPFSSIPQNPTKPKIKVQEKIKPKSKRNKQLIIVAVAVVVGIVAIIGIMSMIRHQKYQKQLDLGQKYLDEGSYQEAILAYDNAITISDKNPEAFKGKAQACVATGDYKTAKEIYGTLYDLTGEESYVQEQKSVGFGNTIGNLANCGLVLESNGAVYIANKPNVGSITKIENGEETVILRGQSDVHAIRDLNIKGDWIFYRMNFMGGFGNLNRGASDGIHKIKCDGTVDTLVFGGSMDTNSLYYNMMIWEDYLYFVQFSGSTNYTSNNGIYRVSVDQNGNVGTNKELIVSGSINSFTSDGESLYVSIADQGVSIYGADGNGSHLISKVEASSLTTNGDNLYYTKKVGYGTLDGYCKMDMDGDNDTKIADSPEYSGAINISKENQVFYAGTDHNTRDYYIMSDIRMQPASGGEETQLLHEAPFDKTGINAAVDAICFTQDKVYYEVTSSSGAGGSYYQYYEMNKDGTENKEL